MQAYANSCVCSATRTALITGRYQYHLPLGLEEPLAVRLDVGLPAEHPTLPSRLKKVGYGTTLIGKWHLGALPTYNPLKCGYDHFWGFRSGGVDYFTHKDVLAQPDLWDGDTPVTVEGYLTDLLGDRAVSAIDEYAKSSTPSKNGLRENTIVIFTSDNGGERFSDNYPFAGPRASRVVARMNRSTSPWTGCRRCWPQPAHRRIRPIRWKA